MPKFLPIFLLIFVKGLAIDAQKYYQAWPILAYGEQRGYKDSVLVMSFSGDSFEFEKYASPRSPGLGYVRSVISSSTGKLVLFSQYSSVLYDSSGRSAGKALNGLGHFDDEILFKSEPESDTVYSLYPLFGTGLIRFRKIIIKDSLQVVTDRTFSNNYVNHSTALTFDAEGFPILALAKKVDTTVTFETYNMAGAIDLFTLEDGELVLKSSHPITPVNTNASFEFSPSGHVIIAGSKLFRVDRVNKSLSQEIDLGGHFNSRGFNAHHLNPTFSSNSRFLYTRNLAVSNSSLKDSVFLTQFDLDRWDESSILASEVDLLADSRTPDDCLRQIQLAPDGRIYGNYRTSTVVTYKLPAVQYPNRKGLASAYKEEYISYQAPLASTKDSNIRVNFPNVSLYISPPPMLDIGPDTLLCTGDSILLQVDPGAHEVHWSTGETTHSIWVHKTGKYAVRVNYPDTALEDTVLIQFAPKPTVYVGPDTAFCDAVDYLIEPTSNGKSFRWNTGDTGKNLYVDQQGRYVLHTRSALSCDNADTVEVRKIDSPELQDLDTTLCAGEEIYIGSKDSSLSYLWLSGDTVGQIKVTKTATHVVRASNEICQTTAVYHITVIPLDSCYGSLYFPNAFSPNGDKHNAKYLPKGSGFILLHLNIYNRWGAMIYSLSADPTGWDGTFKGKPVPEGVYFYTCSYSVFDRDKKNRHTTSGVIHLMR